MAIPVYLYLEHRKSTRISIGTEKVHLRLSKTLDKKELKSQLEWANKWLQAHIERNPSLLKRFKTVSFHNGDRIQVLEDIYVVHIESKAKKSSSASMKGHDIWLSLASGLDPDVYNKSVEKLIHKLLCQKYTKALSRELLDLNDRYFKKDIQSIDLRYVLSKWGSCSQDGNIILSSRLLLCPREVRKYIMIHELAHLIHHDHSPRFWKSVERVMPDYKKWEQWLNKNGNDVGIMPMAALPVAADPPLRQIPQEVSKDGDRQKIKGINEQLSLFD